MEKLIRHLPERSRVDKMFIALVHLPTAYKENSQQFYAEVNSEVWYASCKRNASSAKRQKEGLDKKFFWTVIIWT